MKEKYLMSYRFLPNRCQMIHSNIVQDPLRLNPLDIGFCSVKNQNKTKSNVHNPSQYKTLNEF